MFKKTQKPTAHLPSVGEILQRVSVPFLLFAVVLLGMLFMSAELLLPRLTSISVSGKEHDTAQLKAHVIEVEDKVVELEAARSEYVTPLRQGLYGTVKSAKYSVQSVLNIRKNLMDTIEKSVSEDEGSVAVDSLIYKPQDRVLKINGVIGNAGSKSMTLLATLVETMNDSDWVEDLDLPKFERVYDEKLGFHSPFDFSLHIK